MTDKEIDVTKCMCYENAKCLWTKRYYTVSFCPNCEDVKACYFKQLKRKEQECEKLKEKLSKFFNIDNQECWDVAFMKDENARYKQALDEIEKICKFNFYQTIVRQSVDGSMSYLNKIKDIIKKAKDGNNE